jgi:hypothetical protein
VRMTDAPRAAGTAIPDWLARARETSAHSAAAVARAWHRIPVAEPWRVLLPLLAVHWAALGLFTLRTRNNGWLFYQGGDQIWYYTTGWLLGHGWITDPLVSYGWSLVLAPIALVAGPAYVSALPAVVLLQVVVLAPVALWAVYEIGGRIGGRIGGYLAVLAWTFGPYLTIPLFVQRYHEKYVEQVLPHALGLNGMAEYASLVLMLVATALTLRAVQARDPRAAVVAGLAAGFAGVIKPSNYIFVAAPLVGLLFSRRRREFLAFACSLAPSLGALTLWKYQGFGYVPAFSSYKEIRLASGTGSFFRPYDRYVHINWDHLHINLLQLREIFWSMRLLEWLPLAGAIAVARRSVSTALLLSVWFWSFFVLKGSAESASVEGGSFWRLVMPGIPALLIMVAALPLLVPRLGPGLADRFQLPPVRPLSNKIVVVAALALGVAPLAAAAVVRPLHGTGKTVEVDEIAVPVDGGIALEAKAQGGAVQLGWRKFGTSSGEVFYKLLRSPGATDVNCILRPGGADKCPVTGEVVRATRNATALERPGRGTWTYRVGVGANHLDDPEGGDVFLVSRPVTVTLP